MTPIAPTLIAATAGGPVLAGLPGGYEWLIVLFIILLLFGRRLPGVARSLGQGISSFKKGLNEPLDEEKGRSGSDRPAAGDRPSTGGDSSGDGDQAKT